MRACARAHALTYGVHAHTTDVPACAFTRRARTQNRCARVRVYTHTHTLTHSVTHKQLKHTATFEIVRVRGLSTHWELTVLTDSVLKCKFPRNASFDWMRAHTHITNTPTRMCTHTHTHSRSHTNSWNVLPLLRLCVYLACWLVENWQCFEVEIPEKCFIWLNAIVSEGSFVIPIILLWFYCTIRHKDIHQLSLSDASMHWANESRGERLLLPSLEWEIFNLWRWERSWQCPVLSL